MNNLVPEGWEVSLLGNVINIGRGYAFKSEDYRATGVPIVRVTNIDNNGAINLSENVVYLKEELAKDYEHYTLKSYDVLIVMVGATVGKLARISPTISYSLMNQNMWRLTVKNKSITSQEYSYYALHPIVDSFLSSQQGSASGFLTQRDFALAEVLSPPLPEQQKIAAILTSVDEVIEKTQAQIDKLKDLKTAMMQTLLTNGVGTKPASADAALNNSTAGRESYIPHTEFKDSPVGRIPKSWRVSSLGELASFVTSGSRGWAQYYAPKGPMFIRIGNLTREHINFRFKDVICVTPPDSAEGKRTLVQTGDVLISITADLGVIAVVNDDLGEAYVNQHVSLVRLNNPEISRWVGHFLSHEDSQKQFTANNDSGAKAGLNLTAIRNTKVVIPPADEINQIVRTLDSLDSSIAIKRKKLAKVQDTKKALMQDLLTGKVRVNVEAS